MNKKEAMEKLVNVPVDILNNDVVTYIATHLPEAESEPVLPYDHTNTDATVAIGLNSAFAKTLAKRIKKHADKVDKLSEITSYMERMTDPAERRMLLLWAAHWFNHVVSKRTDEDDDSPTVIKASIKSAKSLHDLEKQFLEMLEKMGAKIIREKGKEDEDKE
jgi:hypothetical protein